MDQLNLSGSGTGACLDLAWDKAGEVLAVLQQGSGSVTLWDAHTKKTTVMDTGMKDLTFLRWSVVGPQLAVGTAKGNLLIYNKQNLRKIPIMGKHTKKIVCGAWNRENKLALGSEDRQITLTTADGDHIRNIPVKSDPCDLQFSDMKRGDRGAERDHTLSVNMARQTILLFNIDESGEKPLELAFQSKYGGIVAFRWYGDGYIMIGFSSGYCVVVSTHSKEIAQEIHSSSLFKETGLADLTVSEVLYRAAACGDNCVRFLDIKDNWKEIAEDAIVLPDEHGQMDRVAWSPDGQIFTLACKSGNLYNFLAHVPNFTARCGARLLYLSSLHEIAVSDIVPGKTPVPGSVIRVGVEPAFVGLGPHHAVVGGNNHAWFYRLTPGTRAAADDGAGGASTPVAEREYIGTVDCICLSSTHVAALSKSVVQLHKIEKDDRNETVVLPDHDTADVTCVALTEDFLFYGNARGGLRVYNVRDGQNIGEHTCPSGVAQVFPNATGTRVVVVLRSRSAYVYSPATDELVEVPEFPPAVDTVIWDLNDWSTFVAADAQRLATYVYSPASMRGPKVEKVGTTDLPSGARAAALHSGYVVCQGTGGALETVLLTTHLAISTPAAIQADRRKAFASMCALHRLKSAWELAHALGTKEVLLELGKLALSLLDVETALRVYRKLGDVSVVLELQKLVTLEDRNLLAGNVALMLGDYGLAQELFLASSAPVEALHMRRDLLDWEQALDLARTLAADQIPFISREYGKHLEFTSQYQKALQMFEAGLTHDPLHRLHDEQCFAGIARTSIRLGDIHRGLEIASKSGSRPLCRDCAGLLEALKQYKEAAVLWEKAENWERAGSLYLRLKNYAAVKPLMDEGRITTPKLFIEYGRAKESDGAYAEAAKAYERAGEFSALVRLNLEKLDNAEAAFAFVRKSRNAEGASLVAKFCVAAGNYKAAIEFFLIARRNDEAFELAKKFDLVAVYAELLKETGDKDQMKRIAEWFEAQSRPGDAGVFYAKCGQHHRALKLFLLCGEKFLNEAIEVVGRAKDDVLTQTLLEFLLGGSDNIPKDVNFIFKTHMAVGNYALAARTANIIAGQEQALGNYKGARDMLFEALRELMLRNLPVPTELTNSLVLLHSYIMVKSVIVLGDHMTAARLLLRVARSISKFPSHVVPILTTTVIETRRAGLKRSAFEYAAMLMRPEHRNSIKPEFLKNIDHIARKPVRTEDDEEASACPYCAYPVLNTTLDCSQCMNTLPWCIITGRHMVNDNWAECPSCHFPALHDAFNTYLSNLEASNGLCPMCQATVPLPVDIVPVAGVKERLTKVNDENAKN